MVEMLAVLAIMGVLAIGGIAAYSFAVSKHRANQIYNQADLRAVASFGNPFVRQAVVGETYPLAGFDEVVENITYQHKKTAGNGYDIIASHVPERVCRRLQDMIFPVPKSVTLNGADLSSTCGSDNTFVFSYDGLSVGKPSSGVDPIDCNCSGCQSCESGTCQDNDNLCGPKEVCQSGSCVCAPGYEECLLGCYTPCYDGQIRQNDTCDCVCTGFKEFDYTQNKCVCKNVPIDGDPDTCGCYGRDDLVDGACVQECPDAIGMTGLRDNEGRCLCNTKLGYEEVSIDDTWCNCDNSNGYWNKPDGSCMTCVQTTKEWAVEVMNWGDSSSVNRDNPDEPDYMVPLYEVDSESVNEDVWYCGLMIATSEGKRVYNPSTKTTCLAYQVLVKDGDQFQCDYACGDEWFGLGKEGDRGASDWSVCRCAEYSLWVNNRCVPACTQTGYKMVDGQCIPYTSSVIVISLENQITYPTNHCRPDVPAWTAGSSNFNYYEWKRNTPSECHAATGYSVQSDDEESECHWSKGCVEYESVLPACTFGDVIDDTCACPTGGSAGEYCCSSAQIKTGSGCQTCTDNTIPNADKTACETCDDDQIPSADRTTCQQCPDGQIPNVTKTKCYPCPDGKYPDTSGTACV